VCVCVCVRVCVRACVCVCVGHWRLLLPVPKEDGEGHAPQREAQSDYWQEVLG
jgi:hypothetical protein